MTSFNKIAPSIKNNLKKGVVSWQSPSNIALVKYWGKVGRQLPMNPSISFTLSHSVTKTKMEWAVGNDGQVEPEISLFFEGNKETAFEAKIKKFLNSIVDFFPFIKKMNFIIHSENTFPHSSGIASSASSMSALSLCLCSIENELCDSLSEDDFDKKASFIARLGSGSACRSIIGPVVSWGTNSDVIGSSNEFGVIAPEIHEKFEGFRDSILIVEGKAKSVSSTEGHALMNDHFFREVRLNQAITNHTKMVEALKTGNLALFGEVLELEALTLHALMMTGKDSYLLMKEGTLSIINKVREFRNEKKIPLYFTLDAGPNVHLLYPDEFKSVVQPFIIRELLPFTEEGKWIDDQVGMGAVNLL